MKSGNARSLTGDILVTEEVTSVLVKTDNGWDLAFADSHSYIIRCKRHVDPYFIKAFLDSDMGKDALKSYIQIGRIDKTPIPIMYEEDVKLISKCIHDIVHEKLMYLFLRGCFTACEGHGVTGGSPESKGLCDNGD